MKKELKQAVRRLAVMHNEHSAGMSMLTEGPHQPGDVVNLTEDADLLGVGGPRLPVRVVDEYLWKNRRHRRVLRERALIWSVYDEDNDRSFVGLGALTSTGVAQRFAAEDSSTEGVIGESDGSDDD